MTRRLLASYLTITAFVLVVLAVPLGVTFESRERTELLAGIERDARVLASLVEELVETGQADRAGEAAASYAREYGGRAVVVDATGFSIIDTDDPTAPAEFFANPNRPEFAEALDGGSSAGGRYSRTSGESFLYVAVPIASGGQVHGAVRLSYPSSTLDERVRDNWLRLGGLSVVVLASVALVGWVLSRSVTRQLRTLYAASQRLAAGDLSVSVPDRRGPPEVRRLAVAFNDMSSRLAELVGAQKAFVGDASHQLRTPLTALRLRLEALADGGRQVDAALEEVERLGLLVEGLLVLARAEGGRHRPEPVDAAGIARERVAYWAALAEEAGVSLRYDGPGAAVMTRAVPGGLEQVIDNLLANALDALGDRGGTVVVSVRPDRDNATIAVADDGPGVPDEQLGRVFDRFWRAPDAPPGGSGLGLAIVRQLARAAGGDASAGRSATLGGFEAQVRLPRV